jgi:plasmid stabilization system protein ParE
MPGFDVEFHPDAVQEAKAAREWYAARSPAAAGAFMEELDHAVQQVGDGPDRWATHLQGTRRYLLRRFPYLLVYRKTSSIIQIVAVAHAKRKPGYWKGR